MVANKNAGPGNANGCFQIGDPLNTDYPYLRQVYPQQFPVGSHEQIIRTDGLGFETSALAKCYYHLVTLRLMEYKWGWNPHKLFSTTNDPSAYDRVVSYPYNQGALEGLKETGAKYFDPGQERNIYNNAPVWEMVNGYDIIGDDNYSKK